MKEWAVIATAAVLVLGYISLYLFVAIRYHPSRRKRVLVKGRWEMVEKEDNTPERGLFSVRWSIPDPNGVFLFVGHYSYNSKHSIMRHAALHMAETQCRRMIELGRLPWEFIASTGIPTHYYK